MIDFIADCFLSLGLIISLVSFYGLLKFKEISSKINAATLFDVGGCSLLLIGLSLKIKSLSVLILIIFLIIISPVTTYLLNQLSEKNSQNE